LQYFYNSVTHKPDMPKENQFRKFLSKEDVLQEACCNYLRWQYPDFLWFHVPNEGKKTPFEQFKYKLLGGGKGQSDIIILEENISRKSKGLAIELKCGDNKCSPEQVQFLIDMSSRGYTAVVVYDFVDEFIRIVNEYLKGMHDPYGESILLRRNGETRVLTVGEALSELTKKGKVQKEYRPNKGNLFSGEKQT
jgi:hypothetical protein